MSANKEDLTMFCDGGARGNPGPAAVGVVVKNTKGHTIQRLSEKIGETTNNVAEYQSVISGLKWIGDYLKKNKLTLRKLTIFLDSSLVVNQLNAKFKIKNPELKELVLKVRRLENKLSLTINTINKEAVLIENPAKVSYLYIPRFKNQEADELVNQALDTKVQ